MAIPSIHTPTFNEMIGSPKKVKEIGFEEPREAVEFSSEEKETCKSSKSSETDNRRPSILKKSRISDERKQEIAGQKRVSIDETQNLVIFIEQLPRTHFLDSMCSCATF